MIRLVTALLLVAATAAMVRITPTADAQDKKTKDGPFAWRKGEARKKMVKDSGATDKSEAAVVAGLKWLATQQKKDGTWVFDGKEPLAKQNNAPATGLALLAFLGQGQNAKDGPHAKTVATGIVALAKFQKPDGSFVGCTQMYGQGIAALALIEAYGVTGNPTLKAPAQNAVNYLVRAQGANGSWGYQAGTSGDTSITGWQVQALLAAKATDLKVPEACFTAAGKFFDGVATGPDKAIFGYSNADAARAGTSLTAIGLYFRQYVTGWTPDTASLKVGIEGLTKRLPDKRLPDTYYAYYASRAVHAHGGEAWEKEWNPPVQELLLNLQAADGANAGSWDTDAGSVGLWCGRLGTTALALLTLETPYRYPAPKKP